MTKHPHLSSPGLNASIIETVSAWFDSSSGALTRSVIIGEVALAHNAADFASSLNTETIRLENFSALEKVAPNPSFLEQQSDSSRPGEYMLSLSHISKPAVGFKYQVSTSTTNPGKHAPLLLTPAWKIEPSQTSAILSYALNPAVDLKGAESITLNNVTLILHLEGARASSCLSKPVGTFSKERNCIFWQLGHVTLSRNSVAQQQQQKLLARFVTDGAQEAKQGKVEAKWEVSGEGATLLGSGLGISVKGGGNGNGGSGEDDPFSDGVGSNEGSWSNVQGFKKVVAGAYQAL